MTSACKILQEMLKHPATKQNHKIGGGIGILLSGDLVFNHSSKLDSYDEDTNVLIRAKFACDHNMVVSPLSTSRMFYTTPENFKFELEEAQRKAVQTKKGWFSRFRQI